MTANFFVATLQAFGSLVRPHDVVWQPCEPDACLGVCNFANRLKLAISFSCKFFLILTVEVLGLLISYLEFTLVLR